MNLFNILFFIVGFIACIDGKTHILHVNMLFRHGDRSSIMPYPFEGYDPYIVWPMGFGQLTQVGIDQHYVLGKWLRNRYHEFQPDQYNLSSFHMRSSDIDRALMSAQSMMAGFYHKSNSSLDKYGLHWRPIPVHTVSRDSDALLAISKCQRREKRKEEIESSEKLSTYLKEHEKMVQTLSTEYKISSPTVKDINQISDDLICLSAHNGTLPNWFTPEKAAELDSMSDFVFEAISTDEVYMKFQVGVYLKETFDKMAAFMSDPRSVEPLVAYSAHDTNVAPLLGAMGVYAGEKKPQYTAITLLELVGPAPHSTSSNDYRLRLFYKRGWKDPSGEYLQFAACKDQPATAGCPFNTVHKALEHLMLDADAYAVACSSDSIPAKYKAIVALTLGGFLVFFFGSLLVVYLTIARRRSSMYYTPLISDESPPSTA